MASPLGTTGSPCGWWSLTELMVHALTPLTATAARQLVAGLPGDGLTLDPVFAEQLAQAARVTPFVAIVAVAMIRRGELSTALTLDKNLQREVMARYGQVATEGIPGVTAHDTRRLLALIAALSPVDLRDEPLVDAMAQFLSTNRPTLLGMIQALTEHGALLDRERVVCVIPDLWGSKTLCDQLAGFLRGSFVLGNEPSENGPALDPLVGQVTGWTVGSWRPKIEGLVRTSTVVVTGVFAKCPAEVLFAKDQHVVGDLAAGGEHEPLCVRVRPWAARWDLADGDAGAGQDGIEGIGELAGPVTDQDLELAGPVAEVHEQVSGLLGGPGAVWVGGDAEDVRVPAADLENEEHVQALQREGAVDVEEVAGQYRGRLRGKEPAPGGVVAARRCRWYPEPFEDAPDRGRADPVAEAA
jgi:hypothetical protein